MVCYFAEIPIATIIQNYLTKNIAQRSAIKIFNAGIIITSIGTVSDQMYSNVITILARSAKESTLILIEESSQDLENWNATILYLDLYTNNMDTNMIHLKTKSRLH
jgi:hypothetical protein